MTGKTVDFYQFMINAEARRAELGILVDEASLEALRNKGFERTASKHALLRAIAKRSRAKGHEPAVSYVDGKRV